MLRGEVVGERHRLRHVVGHDHAAVGRADHLRTFEPSDQALQLLDHAVGQLRRVGHEHAPRKRIVLQLRRQIGGDEVRPGAAVGDHQHLGRPCDPIHADRAEHLALRQRHVDVARPRYDVDPRNRRRAESHRRHRLRSAHPIDGVDAGDVRGRKDRRRHGAVRARRRRQNNLLHARNPGRDGGHQDGRRIRGAAAWRVQPRAANRASKQLQALLTGRRGRHHLGLVELADALSRELEGGAIGRRKPPSRRLELARRHLERFRRARRPAVEPQPVLAQRGVALGSHARADLLHGHPLLRELRQVEPPARPRRVQPRRGVEPLNRQRTPPRAAARPSPAPHRCASSGSPGWR